MEPRGILTSLIVGLIAGWLAGKLARGKGFGLFLNLVLGVVGGLIGGFLFNLVGLHASGLLGSIICCTVGALIVLWLAGKFRGR